MQTAITDSETFETLQDSLKGHSPTCRARTLTVSKGRIQSSREDNWRRGYDWSLSYAALQRHAWAFWNREDIDEETGSKHLIAAAWHCLTMAHWMNNPELAQKYDDRPRL